MRQLAPAPVNELTNVRGVRSAPVRSEPPAPAPVPLREQDRLLPMANIAWLMAAELTKDAKVSRDAKVMMQEFVSEFICFVTSEANDCSLAANRKAISQEDLLNALENLDLASFVPPMEAASKLKDFNSKEHGSSLKRHRGDASERDDKCILRKGLEGLEDSFTSTRSADSLTDSSTRESSPISSHDGSFKSQNRRTLEVDNSSLFDIDYANFTIGSPKEGFAVSNEAAESAAQRSLQQAAVVLASTIIPEHPVPSSIKPVCAPPYSRRPEYGQAAFQVLPLPTALPYARAINGTIWR